MYPLSIMQPSTGVAYGSVILAAVLWGGSIVAQKLALGSFAPVEASVLRDIGGLAILLATWWWQDGTLATLTRADLRTLALLGLGVLGNHLLILIGLKYVSGAVAGVIIGSSPVVTALLSAMLIQDVPLRVVWAGCLLSFAGVALAYLMGWPPLGVAILFGLATVWITGWMEERGRMKLDASIGILYTATMALARP